MTTPFKVPLMSTLIGVNLILIAAFWIIMPSSLSDWQAIIIQSARAVLALLVVVVYAMTISEELGAPRKPHDTLTMGIFLIFFAEFFAAILSIYWRWSGKPIEIVHSQLWAFAPYLTAIAAIHHIITPGSVENRIPKRNFYLAIGAISLAGLVAGFIIGIRVGEAATGYWNLIR
jgi:hypothetical protein